MAVTFADGAVLLSPEEMKELVGYQNRVEALYHEHQVLKETHRKLVGMHNYAILCRDALEEDNIKLRKQLRFDQEARILQINKELVPSNGLHLVVN